MREETIESVSLAIGVLIVLVLFGALIASHWAEVRTVIPTKAVDWIYFLILIPLLALPMTVLVVGLGHVFGFPFNLMLGIFFGGK